MAKNHARLTDDGIKDANPGSRFCITTASLCMTYVHQAKTQKLGVVANAPKEIVHIKDEHFAYRSGTKATKCDSPDNAVHHESATDILDQMVEHEVVKKRDEKPKNGLARRRTVTC